MFFIFIPNIPRATSTMPPVFGARAPLVASSGTVGVRPYPLWLSSPPQREKKCHWLALITITWSNPRHPQNPKCKLWHLCFERDLFLRALERERDRVRDRRDLLDRLEERFFVSALSGRGSFSIRAQQNCVILMAKISTCRKSSCGTWLYSSSYSRLGFPHPFHHTFKLLSSSLWCQLGRFYNGVVGMINSEK